MLMQNGLMFIWMITALIMEIANFNCFQIIQVYYLIIILIYIEINDDCLNAL